MSATLRRVALLVLVLALPLRVETAMMMTTCMHGDAAMHAAVGADGDGSMHDHADARHDGDADATHRHATEGAHVHAACCAGMIATSPLAWRAPAGAPPFPIVAAPPVVPTDFADRLERPPRPVVA